MTRNRIKEFREVRDSTIGALYGPAMRIVDQTEADEYFEELVRTCMSLGRTREQAESIERSNLGYYSGYYDHEVQERVFKLFRCAHPVFGSTASSEWVNPLIEYVRELEAENGRYNEALQRIDGAYQSRQPDDMPDLATLLGECIEIARKALKENDKK